MSPAVRCACDCPASSRPTHFARCSTTSATMLAAPDFCSLIDLRAIRSVHDLTGETVRVVASRPLAVARQALVACDPVVFGICRMFATYRELAAREPVAACRTIDEA